MTRCSDPDCIRGDGQQWPQGPDMCVPHRRIWAADHESELSDEEWQRWADEDFWETPKGQLVSAWPDNFKTTPRPTREELEKMNQKYEAQWKVDREARARQRQEEQPHFGQRRWPK